MNKKYRGQIKIYYKEKGYGYILPDANQGLSHEPFMHISDFIDDKNTPLFEGMKLEFELKPNKIQGKPDQASNIKLLEVEIIKNTDLAEKSNVIINNNINTGIVKYYNIIDQKGCIITEDNIELFFQLSDVKTKTKILLVNEKIRFNKVNDKKIEIIERSENRFKGEIKSINDKKTAYVKCIDDPSKHISIHYKDVINSNRERRHLNTKIEFYDNEVIEFSLDKNSNELVATDIVIVKPDLSELEFFADLNKLKNYSNHIFELSKLAQPENWDFENHFDQSKSDMDFKFKSLFFKINDFIIYNNSLENILEKISELSKTHLESIDDLNDCLMMPNYYDKFKILLEKNELSNQLSIDIIYLIHKTKSLRDQQYQSLSAQEKFLIVKLNRLIIEEFFYKFIKIWKFRFPVLSNYVTYTFNRLKYEEEKSQKAISKIFFGKLNDNDYSCFNTGLLDKHHRDIYALFVKNKNEFNEELKDYLIQPEWLLSGFCTSIINDNLKNAFSSLPEIADYFEEINHNLSLLIYDTKKNHDFDFEHIGKRRDRIPPKYRKLNDEELNDKLTSMLNKVKKIAKRNYKLGIPQYYENKLQLLLPLYWDNTSSTAESALVVDITGNTYVSRTIFTLEMAYNNARLITKPDRDWLNP